MPFRGETDKGLRHRLGAALCQDLVTERLGPNAASNVYLGGAQYRKSLPLQSGLQERLQHGSERHHDDAGSDPGNHGDHRRRAREGDRVNRQFSLDARSANSSFWSASSSLISSSGCWRSCLLLLMSLFLFSTCRSRDLSAPSRWGPCSMCPRRCGFGQLISTFTRTQVAAVFATTVLAVIPTVNFSGLLVPVSSLSGQGRLIGLMFPAAWFQPISVGTFTKDSAFLISGSMCSSLRASPLGYLIGGSSRCCGSRRPEMSAEKPGGSSQQLTAEQ